MKSIQVIPEAFYDSISLAHKLDAILDGFKLEEIHLFSYFSSILFLYRGKLLIDWKYKFIIDTKGYPFSKDLNTAIERHLKNGLFDKKETYYLITSRGTDEFNKFKNQDLFMPREEYLNAACTTNILIPYAKTLRALLNDPEINRVKQMQNESWLRQSDSFEKFKEISIAVGITNEDLILSAVTWINYINEKGNSSAGGKG